jgi:hypothetical protein
MICFFISGFFFYHLVINTIKINLLFGNDNNNHFSFINYSISQNLLFYSQIDLLLKVKIE